jgi:hypothetical protein
MDLESVCSENMKHKDERERERERESIHKAIYTGSYYKLGIVHSSCTSKGFYYNLTRLQMLKDTSKILSNVKAHTQETFNVQ